ncbi:MAG: CSLREA domain-containing protein [Gemmatimonadales bacterium]
MTRTYIGAALALAMMMPTAARAQTVTYTVNSTADTDDGVCDANCTLREAIAAANAGPSLDTIAFAIPGPGTKRIEPLAPLPTVVNPVVIDGTTQPGHVETPLIDLLGASAGAGTVGLTLSADGSTVKGLRVRGFATGILIDGGAGNVIGGEAASQSNEIIDNGGAGVRITGAAATGNRVQWNTIAGNGGPGVTLPDAGTGNAISFNSISENGALGIDLGDDGVTPNDAGDADTGPNDLQNYPVMDKAVFGVNRAEGTVNTRPNTDLTVEFYSSEDCDATGHGEGLTLHGFTDVTSDAAGDAEFSFTLVGNVPLGRQVTATATDADGNTSEFSNCTAATTYSIYASPDSGLVWRGGSDEYAVFATPEGGAWGQLITMSCANLPGVTTCEFTPDTFTLGATEFRSNLVVTTTDLSQSSAPVIGGGTGPAAILAALIVGLGLLGLAVASAPARRTAGRARRLGLRVAALAVVVFGLAFYTACGDDGTTEVIDAGTPRGKHTFTIVATSNSLVATTSAILVVN